MDKQNIQARQSDNKMPYQGFGIDITEHRTGTIGVKSRIFVRGKDFSGLTGESVNPFTAVLESVAQVIELHDYMIDHEIIEKGANKSKVKVTVSTSKHRTSHTETSIHPCTAAFKALITCLNEIEVQRSN